MSDISIDPRHQAAAQIAALARGSVRAGNLRRLRGKRTSEAMGELCTIKASHLREMEVGHRAITIKTIDRLADGLRMDPAAVLSELDRRIGR